MILLHSFADEAAGPRGVIQAIFASVFLRVLNVGL
jgi:hypothetical protein